MSETTDAAGIADRRSAVLDSALHTFARYGYRKTSMSDIAAEAKISRPGLYFLFSSKEALFRAAAERGLALDIAAADRAFSDADTGLARRIVDAFDQWTGRYLGPLRDISAVLDDNPHLVGPAGEDARRRFVALLTRALEGDGISDAASVARVLVSTSIGVKHQSTDLHTYRERMAEAVRLLVSRT